MASHFTWISEKEILSVKEEAVLKNTKMATKFGVISPASYSRAKIEIQCLFYETVKC